MSQALPLRIGEVERGDDRAYEEFEDFLVALLQYVLRQVDVLEVFERFVSSIGWQSRITDCQALRQSAGT